MPWQDLGIQTPVLNRWTEYGFTNPEALNPIEGAVFRFTPGNIDPLDSYVTYALARFRYDDTEREYFTRPIRIYPRAEPIIQVVPVPTQVNIFPFSWIPQVRKFVYPRFRGRSPESPWTIQIEDFYPEPNQAQESIEQAVNALVNVQRFLY